VSSLLLFTEILLLWCLCSAGRASDSLQLPLGPSGARRSRRGPAARAVAAAFGVLVVLWALKPAGILLAFVAAASVWSLVQGRSWASRVALSAEFEIASVVLFAALSGAVVLWGDLAVGFPFLSVPTTENRLAFLNLMASGFVLAIWHSGNVVYGVLQRNRLLPDAGSAGSADHDSRGDVQVVDQADDRTRQLRTGRLIGYLERILIVVLVIKGSYEGLGFLIAAKGLIRAREFEHKHRAEYFLVGTLLSVVCALAIGIAIQVAYSRLW
jgi:hypothetical protein